MSKIDYNAVLRDLIERKLEIEAAITAIGRLCSEQHPLPAPASTRKGRPPKAQPPTGHVPEPGDLDYVESTDKSFSNHE